MTHESHLGHPHKHPEQLAKHVAEPTVGGEFNDYDPKGRLSKSARFVMGKIINTTRSLDTAKREPAEIVRMAQSTTTLSEQELHFLDRFAAHAAHNTGRYPKHRKGDEAKQPKHPKHKLDEGSSDLIMPL